MALDITLVYIQDETNSVAYNYATVEFNQISKTDSDQVPGLSQTIHKEMHEEIDDSSGDLFDFLDGDSNSRVDNTHRVSPYAFLVCSFKALMHVMDGNSEQKDLDDMNKFFMIKLGEMNTKIATGFTTASNNENTSYVSSNLASSKRKKTYDASGFQKK